MRACCNFGWRSDVLTAESVRRRTAEEEQSLASHRVSTDAACARLARDLRVMIALSDIACGLLFCSC